MATTYQPLTPDSIDDFLNWKAKDGLSQNSIRAYKADLNGLMKQVDKRGPVGSWNALESRAQDWLAEMRQEGMKPNTVNRKLSTTREWARWAGCEDMLATYKPPVAAQRIPRVLHATEIRRLVDKSIADGDIEGRLILSLQGTMGLRISEVMAIRPSDIDLDEMILMVHGKGAKQRELPISDIAAMALSLGMISTPDAEQTIISIQERQARRKVNNYGERVLGKQVSSHMLRASAATHWLDEGFDIRTVSRLLGHGNLRTTMRYIGANTNAMRAAVNSMGS